MSQSLEEQIIDLQSRLAHQDHSLQELNEVVTSQQRELDRVTRALRTLSEQFRSWRDDAAHAGTGHELPPHY